jgi:dTDP-4-dehydrorhamnose 3,5-epimerase
MKFEETSLPGVFVIELERREDERGWFARGWCREEFAAHGLPVELTQCNLSHNTKRGTLRGMHWQAAPNAEAKLVRCVAGAAHDVALDLRPQSPAYLKSFATELSVANGRAVFLPEGVAHGFQSLADDTTLFYQMSESYFPEAARGARWNDPAFAIDWPIKNPIMSERDRSFPDFTNEQTVD